MTVNINVISLNKAYKPAEKQLSNVQCMCNVNVIGGNTT